MKRQCKLPFFGWLRCMYFYTSILKMIFISNKNSMKKIIVSLLFVFGLLFSLTKADDLSTASLSFCDSSDTLNIALEPGVQTGICYQLTNGGKNEITVKLGFVDGTFTNDERKNRACQLDNQIQMFGKYVTGYSSIVTLQAGQTISGEALLKYPERMNGLFHGCLVYSIITPEKANAVWTTSFSIQMRRAKFIDVISGNPDELMNGNTIVLEEFTDADGENLSSNPKIRIYKDIDDGYMVALKLKNIGVFDENVAITWIVSNILTYKNVFVSPRLLTPGQDLLVTQKLFDKPNFNFSIKIFLSHMPSVFGGVEAKGWSFQESTRFIIRNIVTRLTLIGLLVVAGIIFLLVKDLRRKSKKVNASKRTKNKK